LLKTKAKVPFDRAVDRTVEAFFCLFQRSNLAQFQPDFSVFTVRSAEGRKCESPARKTGVPDKPVAGLAGWKFAALQTVIVSERRSLPRVERSKARQSLHHISG
jgi:hypothetical protein